MALGCCAGMSLVMESLEGKRTRSFFTDPRTVSYIQPVVLFVP